MGELRVRKVQEFIKEEVSHIILRKLKDPRIGFVTVTDVAVTGDLRNAKIFVSLFGNDDQKKDTMQALRHALGFIRMEIGQKLQIRCTPEITFVEDTSLDYSVKIEKILHTINDKEKKDS
jgi:ribosome-binding factor A